MIDTMGAMKGDQLHSLAQKNLDNYNKLIDQFEQSYNKNRDYHS